MTETAQQSMNDVWEGWMGKDARCFDVDTWDEERLAYVESRLSEACSTAAQGL